MKHIEITCNSLMECNAKLRQSDLLYVSDLGHKATVVIDIDTDSPFDGSFISIPDHSEKVPALSRAVRPIWEEKKQRDMDYEKEYEEDMERAKAGKPMDEVFPELKESEDERIRKWLVELVKNTDTNHSNIKLSENCKLALAYLEKQKEQKPSTEETELNSIAFLEQMGYTCIPPKKEHQNNSDAPKNALGGALNSPLDKDKNLDDIAQDYVEAVKEYNPELTWDLMQTAVCYGYHYREEEEQKPNIELIQRSWYMEGYHDREFCREPKWIIKPGKGGPKYEKNEKYGQPLEQKPAEWSEEDEAMLENVLGTYKTLEDMLNLSTGQDRDILASMNFERDWLKGRFNFLRPQQKQDGVWITKEQFEQIKSASYLTGKLDHWKPSEEQMSELNWASKLSPVLESLYNDLKKLM